MVRRQQQRLVVRHASSLGSGTWNDNEIDSSDNDDGSGSGRDNIINDDNGRGHVVVLDNNVNTSTVKKQWQRALTTGTENEESSFTETNDDNLLSSSSTRTISTTTKFSYEFDPRTGLPIFDIDQCSNDELLGGEISPLSSSCIMSLEEELQAVHWIKLQLSSNEKYELTDPRMIVRHVRAEKGNRWKALETLKEALQWRREFEVTALRACMSDHPDKVQGTKDYRAMMKVENATAKTYVRGTTKDGRALVYMFAMRNNTHNDYDNIRHLVWNLEKAIRVTFQRSQGRLDKYCLLIDCHNYQLSKAPSIQLSKMTLDVLQKHFKERIHRIYVLNPPLAFRIFWNLIQAFVDPVTKTKLVFCTPKGGGTGVQQLHHDVGSENLEPCAFGTHPLRPVDPDEYLELPMEIGFDQNNN